MGKIDIIFSNQVCLHKNSSSWPVNWTLTLGTKFRLDEFRRFLCHPVPKVLRKYIYIFLAFLQKCISACKTAFFNASGGGKGAFCFALFEYFKNLHSGLSRLLITNMTLEIHLYRILGENHGAVEFHMSILVVMFKVVEKSLLRGSWRCLLNIMLDITTMILERSVKNVIQLMATMNEFEFFVINNLW